MAKIGLFIIILSPSVTTSMNIAFSNITCSPNYKLLTISPVDHHWLDFIEAASAEISNTSSNCQEIRTKSLKILEYFFNNSLNVSDLIVESNLQLNLGRLHNVTYNIDFFDSLTMLISKVSRKRMDQCLKDKALYKSDTGVCIKEDKKVQNIMPKKGRVIIKVIGNSTSILTLILLLVILTLFEELKTIPGRYMTHLSVVLLFGQTLLLLSPVGEKNSTVCALLGVLVHWTYLTVFSLMCMIAVSTTRTFCQPLMVSQNEKSRRYQLAMKAAYGFPLVITTPCLLTQFISPSKVNYGGHGKCFITNEWANLFTFIVPVGSILLFNCVCLMVAVYRIHRTNKENTRILRRKRSFHKLRIQALILIIKLGTFTGMGWIFGFIGSLTSVDAFNWIFEILCSFQGFGIFCGFACSIRMYNIFIRKIQSKKKKLIRPSLDKQLVDSKTTQM